MNKTLISERFPVLCWLRDIEDGALQQAINLANLPFVFKHIALMPDCHQGYGMPIGGVLATENVIIPNCVGVDIGCGMCAVRTSLTEIDTETLQKIIDEIRKVIPVGFKKHPFRDEDCNLMPMAPSGDDGDFHDCSVIEDHFENGVQSLGTLGGGNHFIEIQKGNDDYIWIMIHSGSRNLGKQVADHYNKIAKELNAYWFSSVPKEFDLAFLPIDSDEGQAYIREMQYCIDFALINRKLMMERVKGIFSDTFGVFNFSAQRVKFVGFGNMINVAHNYAALENHFGKNVWVHRKGATLARKGTVGIIPGSQGTKSYIVKGKGNRDSFESCSHGAGRRMGRKEAQRTLSLEEEIKNLNDKGIIHTVRTEKDLDEAPGAYKDIREVMKDQEDLVEILVCLEPLAVIKG